MRVQAAVSHADEHIDSASSSCRGSAGGSEMLMGYTLFAMCVAEVPVFFYTGALLKRVGIDVVLHVVLGCLVLRSLAYTAMPRFAGPWFAAPVRYVPKLPSPLPTFLATKACVPYACRILPLLAPCG